MKCVIAALSLGALIGLGSHSSIRASGPYLVDSDVVDSDAARQERARQWQAELVAREMEIERANRVGRPLTTVAPIAVVRDRSTFAPYVALASTPPVAFEWTLAERRTLYLRPFAHEYLLAEFQQPRPVPNLYAETPLEAVGQRVGAEVGASLGGPNGAAIGAQAGRAADSEIERR